MNETPLTGPLLRRYLLISIAFYTSLAAFAWDWINSRWWPDETIIWLLATAFLTLTLAKHASKWALLPRMRRPIACTPEEGLRVAVVTTYVPESESLQMIEVTLQAMVRMQYPHQCWLLDEGDTAEAQALCRKLGVLHFSRRNKPRYQSDSGRFQKRSKHGNYNAWLEEIGFSRYDVVVGVDPDHIVEPCFLMETLGYFTDPAVGYVQSAQAYYNTGASFIARGAAEETYDFYSTIQMAAYGAGLPSVIGCHNIHRVTALRDVGGFAPHDADDLLITLCYRAKGWKGVYLPRILARGITPVDWNSYLSQQRRWARSVLDLKLRIQHSLAATLPAEARTASYAPVLAYLEPLASVGLAISIALLVVLQGQLPAFVHSLEPWTTFALALTWVASGMFRQSFFLDPDRERGFHWRGLVTWIGKTPALLLAVLDVAAGRRFEYVMTPKVKASQATFSLLSLSFGSTAILFAVAWFAGIYRNSQYEASAHTVAALVLAFCLALIASQKLRPPEPFDPELARAQLKLHQGAPCAQAAACVQADDA